MDRGSGQLGMILIANLGAAVNVILGCLGLLFPQQVSRVLAMRPEGPRGISEVRATYGGFFLGLGLGCLATQSDTVFLVAGSAWYGAAIARLMSVMADKSRSRENIIGFVVEATVGMMLLSAILKFS